MLIIVILALLSRLLDEVEYFPRHAPTLGLTVREAGALQARVEFALGRPCYKECGLAPDWRWIFNEKLLAIGVEPRVVAGCIVSDERVEWVAGYDECVNGLVDERDGAGTMERLMQAARHEAKTRPAPWMTDELPGDGKHEQTVTPVRLPQQSPHRRRRP